MRVLFFTAAAIAALSTVTQAVRLSDEPIYEYAEMMSESEQTATAAAKKATPQNGVKISLNADTQEFNVEAGPKVTDDTQSAVMNALTAHMTDFSCDKAGDDEKKKAVDTQKKTQEKVTKAADESREADKKAKKVVEDAKEEAKKSADDGKKKLRDLEAQVKEEE
jgi:hypothetical protein